MIDIKEASSGIVKRIIRGALSSTIASATTGPRVNPSHPNPDDLVAKPEGGAKLSSNRKTTSKKNKKVVLKLKENYEEKVRVAYQRPEKSDDKPDIGDDTSPPLPKEDELQQKRRNAMKRFRAYFDV